MKINDLQNKMMNRAISLARKGGATKAGGPFGAVITKDKEVIAESSNQVSGENDCTQHAELRVIQKACRILKSTSLKGCVLFTSCEPCMMCLGAAYWAKLDNIYYGASAEDAKTYGFIYSVMYYNSEQKHSEFNMIQLCRNEALEVWKELNINNKKI